MNPTGTTGRAMAANRTRDGKAIQVRLTLEEHEMLAAVAKHAHLDNSNWLRHQIASAYTKLAGKPQKPKR